MKGELSISLYESVRKRLKIFQGNIVLNYQTCITISFKLVFENRNIESSNNFDHENKNHQTFKCEMKKKRK